MNLRDYIFKILKEQIFFERIFNVNQVITDPEERKKVNDLVEKSGLSKNEIYELAVGDPTHNILGPIAKKLEIDGNPLVFLDAMIRARKKGIPIEDIIAEAKKQYNKALNKEININDAVYNVRVMSLEPKPEESNDASYFDLISAGEWYHIYRWATYYRDLLLDDVLKR